MCTDKNKNTSLFWRFKNTQNRYVHLHGIFSQGGIELRGCIPDKQHNHKFYGRMTPNRRRFFPANQL